MIPGYVDDGNRRFGLGRVAAQTGWIDFFPEWGAELAAGHVDFVAFLVDEYLLNEFFELVLSGVMGAMDSAREHGFTYVVGRLEYGEPPPLAVIVSRTAAPAGPTIH